MSFLPDVILLGQFPIAVGALTSLLGGFLAYLASGWSARRTGSDPEAAQDLVLNLLIGGVLGAKLLYVALDLPGHLANPVTLILFPYGPLALPAGAAGGLALVVWGLRSRTDRLRLLDAVALPILLGLTVSAAGWKGPGAWASLPALGLAALLVAWAERRWKDAPEGHRAALAVAVAALAIAAADTARPAPDAPGGVTTIQLAMAAAATLSWLWTRYGRRSA